MIAIGYKNMNINNCDRVHITLPISCFSLVTNTALYVKKLPYFY